MDAYQIQRLSRAFFIFKAKLNYFPNTFSKVSKLFACVRQPSRVGTVAT